MHKPVMHFVLGPPGAGKSTFADELLARSLPRNTQLIRFDALRRAYGHVYCHALEPTIHATAGVIARMAFVDGRDVLIDESITLQIHAAQLAVEVRAVGGRIVMYVLDVPENVCRERRIPQGFPVGDFNRKVHEWEAYAEAILILADEVRYVVNPNPTE